MYSKISFFLLLALSSVLSLKCAEGLEGKIFSAAIPKDKVCYVQVQNNNLAIRCSKMVPSNQDGITSLYNQLNDAKLKGTAVVMKMRNLSVAAKEKNSITGSFLIAEKELDIVGRSVSIVQSFLSGENIKISTNSTAELINVFVDTQNPVTFCNTGISKIDTLVIHPQKKETEYSLYLEGDIGNIFNSTNKPFVAIGASEIEMKMK